MKKLIIAAAVVGLAVASPAASFNWKTAKSGGAVNAFEGGSIVESTVYIFTSDQASSILSAWAAGEAWSSGALDSSTIASTGKIAAKSTMFDYGGAGTAATIDAIFAFTERVGDKDYFYISTTASASSPATGSATINFTEGGVSTSVMDAASFSGAGWYAIPEPTSGLLMLVGLAGLALRRKRA